ncbi:hypothetical protein DERP_002649 [Dermatophagoides pteronyssinus]|uniref:Uncharacterized protein n=1 Tax=Dermatophagoides pteronyssinus TaxID=6956 RepID=A0ABQ8JVW7_DERPT|nr:hypothetical protein DERP_002649 [Dermatophagoides pteronyssinus]
MNSIPKSNVNQPNEISSQPIMDSIEKMRVRIMKTVNMDYRFENLNHIHFNSYSKNYRIQSKIRHQPSQSIDRSNI